MWVVIDLIIVAIVSFFVFLSIKRGFIKTAVELLGYALAVYLAFTLGGVMADVIYNGVVQPSIVKTVEDKITTTSNENIDETVDNVWNALPGYVVNAAEHFDVSPDTLKKTINENYINEENTAVIAEKTTDSIAKPIVIPLIKTVLGLILFFVLIFFVKILAKVINKIFKLPIINGLNKFLGGIIGFLKGAVISYVFVVVVLFIMSFFENGFWIFTKENIDQTVLFKFLAEFSPFK